MRIKDINELVDNKLLGFLSEAFQAELRNTNACYSNQRALLQGMFVNIVAAIFAINDFLSTI